MVSDLGPADLYSKAMGHVVAIMPFVEESAAYNQMDFITRGNEAPNDAITAKVYPFVLCPSHSIQSYTRGAMSIQHFGGSGGTNGASCLQETASTRPNGIFWSNSRCRLEHISDGTSKTVLALPNAGVNVIGSSGNIAQQAF